LQVPTFLKFTFAMWTLILFQVGVEYVLINKKKIFFTDVLKKMMMGKCMVSYNQN
jgi:hypothetical protein